MKKFNKILAVVLTVVLCLAMVLPATAASIAISDDDTHTYRVFQVLTGTLSEEGSKELGNPAWGEDAIDNPGSVDAFIEAITADGLSEAEIAALVAAKVDLTGNGQGTVDADNDLENLATGYYVLVDETELENNDGESLETLSLHVVQVLNDVELVRIKYGTTEVDKEITGDTLGTATTASPRNPDDADTDNVSIGDTVNFQITAKVPENAGDYNYFYFVINDTLDPGLTLDPTSIRVYKTDTTNANVLTLTTDYLLKTGTDPENAATYADGKSFQVGLVDAKSHAGEDIIVTYSAVLNEHANIGEVPNENKTTVTFSNDPNHNYNGDTENPSPGFPAQTDLPAMGETPEDKTETYTTGIEIQKVDENGNVLTGAEFTIEGDSTEIVLVSSETFTVDNENGEYYLLKNNTYTKQPPVVADYMEEAPAGATAGYVADPNADGEDAITVGGIKYRPVTAEDLADDEVTVYILVKANADQYDEEGDRYTKTVTYTQKNTTGNNAVDASAEVGPDGVVRFVGLGAGEYTITETVTPPGYNTISELTIKIEFDKDPETGEYHWSYDVDDSSEGFTYNPETGVFETTIVNQKGQELPTTGGMGTTIFYVLGTVLLLGACVVLISRKRMGAAA